MCFLLYAPHEGRFPCPRWSPWNRARALGELVPAGEGALGAVSLFAFSVLQNITSVSALTSKAPVKTKCLSTGRVAGALQCHYVLR